MERKIKMNTYLLGFLGIVLLIFCVIDLYHLKEMLKVLRKLESISDYVYNTWLEDRKYR